LYNYFLEKDKYFLIDFSLIFRIWVYLPQGFVLHTCVSSADPSHCLPPHDDDGFVHDRYRFRTPEPHCFVHADQSDQCENFPSTWQQSTLHDRMSRKFSFVQFSIESVWYWRVRSCWPPSHGKEHCDHWLQFVKSHVQLTPCIHGHGLPVQGNVSILSLAHKGFGWDEPTVIKLCLRVRLPVWPHEAPHILHSHHEEYLQSSTYNNNMFLFYFL
jgi:hypothetical protein